MHVRMYSCMCVCAVSSMNVYTYTILQKNYSGRESRNFYIYFPFDRKLILSVITLKNYFYEIISNFLLYLILVSLQYLLFGFINYMHFLLNHYSNFHIERIRNWFGNSKCTTTLQNRFVQALQIQNVKEEKQYSTFKAF